MKNKQKNELAKRVRKYMQARYAQIVEYLYKEENKEAEKTVQYFLDNEPDFALEVQRMQEAQALAEKRKEFNSIDMSTPELEKYLEHIHNDMLLIVDCINRETAREATTEMSLKQKMGRVSNLSEKLDQLEEMYNLLTTMLDTRKKKNKKAPEQRQEEQTAEKPKAEITTETKEESEEKANE